MAEEYTASEILTLVKEKEEELNALYTRMDEDFDLYALTGYEADEGYESYTSSMPRNFFDKVTDGLSRAEMTLQIKLPEDATIAEQKAASLGELFLFGALNQIDRNLRARGEPPLREGLGFWANLRGWIGLKALVYVVDGETVFDVQSTDILHLTWEMGHDGLLWLNTKRKISKAQVKAEYGITINTKDTELLDFWTPKTNSILIEQSFAKPPTEHKRGHIPFFVGAVGAMPTVLDKEFNSTIEHRGDSVWTASRKLFNPFNKITSRTMDLYERSVAGSLIHKSPMGDKSIEGDPYKTFQEIKIGKDEEIAPLEAPEPPATTAILHSIISQDIQQSTLPYPLAYGGTTQAMSGTALSVLVDATRSVYDPRTSLLEEAYTWLCEEMLTQYTQKGIKAVNLNGNKPDGKFFYVKVRPKEINPKWTVSVVIEPKMPRDRQIEIMTALAATQQRSPQDIPLISKQTAREDILKIRDPSAEEDKALSEMGESLPPILATKIAAALKARGQDDLAQDVLMLLAPQEAQRTANPQLPPQLLAAAIEALAANPQTRELAAMMLKALGVTGTRGQGAPQMAPQQAQGMQGAPQQGVQGSPPMQPQM